MSLSIIRPNWSAPENVVALSTNRLGGESSGDFQGFNLAMHVGDRAERVAQNRTQLGTTAGLPAEPIWLDQIHSTRVIDLDEASDEDLEQPADASTTRQINKVCVVMTADCLPLLLCNRAGTQVAAIHAGWRGMASGIIERCCQRFDESPDQILAWAGPTIGAQKFEIGEEVKQQLAGHSRFYSPSQNSGKYLADLYGLAGERLASIGVNNYAHTGDCTYSDQRYFSYRRDGRTGRQATLIYLRDVS